MSIYVFSYFTFGFEGRIWDLIVSVPDYCLSFHFVDPDGRLVIMGDFNVPVNEAESPFVHFMETLFSCSQYIRQPTTDSGSVLDLVFANCDAICDVIEAYWTDHKLIYCALDA